VIRSTHDDHDTDHDTLESWLERMSVNGLRPLARAFADRVPTRKGELVVFVASRTLGENLRRHWEALGEMERLAVAEVVHSGRDRLDVVRFVARYGAASFSFGETDKWGRVRRADAFGLLFPGGRMPAEIKTGLRALVPPPPEPTVATTDDVPEVFVREDVGWKNGQRVTAAVEVPVVRAHRERAALDELVAVLRLVDLGEVSVSERTSRPTAAGVRAVAGGLAGGDFFAGTASESELGPVRAYAWPCVVQAAKLARRRGTKLELTPAGRRSLLEPPTDVLRTVFDAWIASDLFDEFQRIDVIKGQTGRGKRSFTSVSDRRHAIVEALARSTPERWVEVGEFFRFVRASDERLSVTQNDPWALYISHARYGSLGYAGSHSWELIEGRYALAFLLEYAATLGAIDVAYVPPHGVRDEELRGVWGADELTYLSRYDGLLAVRVNRLGAWLLRGDDATEFVPEPSPPVFEFRPDGTFRELGDLAPGDAPVLDGWCDPVAPREWRLSPAKVLDEIERGREIAEVVAFLESRVEGGELPRELHAALDRLGAASRVFEDRGSVRLLASRDPDAARALVADPKLRGACRLAGDRHVLFEAQHEASVRQALKQRGFCLRAPKRGAAQRKLRQDAPTSDGVSPEDD